MCVCLVTDLLLFFPITTSVLNLRHFTETKNLLQLVLCLLKCSSLALVTAFFKLIKVINLANNWIIYGAKLLCMGVLYSVNVVQPVRRSQSYCIYFNQPNHTFGILVDQDAHFLSFSVRTRTHARTRNWRGSSITILHWRRQ